MIDEVLSTSGYVFSFYARQVEGWGTTAGWVRPASTQPCFDRLLLFLYGKAHERISVHLGVSMVPTGNTWRGLFDGKTFTHSDSSDGLFKIRTTKETTTFIRTILPEVSAAHQIASRQLSPALVSRTQKAVEASQYFRRQLPSVIDNLQGYWEQQLLRLSRSQYDVVKRFRYWDVISLPYNNDEEEERVILCYKIAVLTIVSCGENAPSHFCFDHSTTVDDSMDFAWCVQILASQIHSPQLWQLTA
jgi:hypothetical protein